jgi:L-alanine-DL-glutamate epimerase-like enolase superfamily enzyme
VIERVDAFPLAYPEPHYRGVDRSVTLVRIETGDGVAGWGEGISQSRPSSLATKEIVDGAFAPLLLGEDPTDIDRAWRAMCDAAWWFGVEGIAAFAISAVDMALWDLNGKLQGQPVAALLGAELPAERPAMGSIIFDMEDLDWTLAEFDSMRRSGYRIVKAGWGMRPEAMLGQDRERDLRYLTEVRGVIGDELGLVVDVPGVQGIWDLDTAIERLREWEPFGLRWVEQPLLPADLADHARLRSAVGVPVGAGEDGWSPATYRRVLEARAVDVLQLDPGRCLGLTGARKVVQLAEAAGVAYSAHSWSGALNTAASLAFLALSERGDTLDFKPHESPMQHELVDDPWIPRDGMLGPRPEPGLGVAIREDAVERYRFG